MSFEALRSSVEGRMNTGYSTTPVSYENVPYTPGNTPWVALFVQTGQGVPLGISGTNRAARDTGLVSMQVFVPEGSGSSESNQLIDELVALYESTRFDGILTYTATVTHVGIDNGWHQTNITVPFRRARYV